jgi:hypothetical protein
VYCVSAHVVHKKCKNHFPIGVFFLIKADN